MTLGPLDIKGELLRDGVAEQRKKGLPRPNDLDRYLTAALDRIDRSQEDQRLRIKPKPRTEVTRERSSTELEAEYQKRCRRFGLTPAPGKWSIERNPAPKIARPATLADQTRFDQQRTALQKRRLRARLRLLRSNPDWADKIKRINPLAIQGQLGADKQKQAEELVKQVIRDSDRVFGPWMAPPKKKLRFDMGAKRK